MVPCDTTRGYVWRVTCVYTCGNSGGRWLWSRIFTLNTHVYIQQYIHGHICTANPTWGDIFESSKLKARTSLLPHFTEKRLSSFELWALKQHSKMSPQVGLAVYTSCIYICTCTHLCMHIRPWTHMYIYHVYMYIYMLHGLTIQADDTFRITYIHIHACIHIQIYIHTYIYK